MGIRGWAAQDVRLVGLRELEKMKRREEKWDSTRKDRKPRDCGAFLWKMKEPRTHRENLPTYISWAGHSYCVLFIQNDTQLTLHFCPQFWWVDCIRIQ